MQCTSVIRRGGARIHPFLGLHLRVVSGGKGFSLEIPAYLRPSEGKLFFFFSLISALTAVASEWILTCCSLGIYCFAVLLHFALCYVLANTNRVIFLNST